MGELLKWANKVARAFLLVQTLFVCWNDFLHELLVKHRDIKDSVHLYVHIFKIHESRAKHKHDLVK